MINENDLKIIASMLRECNRLIEICDRYNNETIINSFIFSDAVQYEFEKLYEALLKKPKILILDDSTSAVDTKTDKLIRKALKEDLPEMTKIVIAQRISSIEDADQIVVMNDGRIDAIGTHDELIKSNKIYQEVYYTQNKVGGDK